MRSRIKRQAKRKKGIGIRQSPFPRWLAVPAAIVLVVMALWFVHDVIYHSNPIPVVPDKEAPLPENPK
jgi:hypothetical protein